MFGATYPLVFEVQIQGQNYAARGRHAIPVGHAGHTEIIGAMGRLDDPVHLIQTKTDVDALEIPTHTPVAYVTQTTLSVDEPRGILASLGEHFNDIFGPNVNDICYTTQNRQSTVRALSKRADVLLVAGAQLSTRLRQRTRSDLGMRYGTEMVGITAGASAPDSMAEDVIEALRRLRVNDLTMMDGI